MAKNSDIVIQNGTDIVIEMNAVPIAYWGGISGDIESQIDLKNKLLLKVDKVDGKDLSSNDFTDEDKNKLDGLENYILPSDVVQDENYTHTDNNFTDAEQLKLAGLQEYIIGDGLTLSEDGVLSANAQSQIQSDCAQTDNTKPDFIKNKDLSNFNNDTGYLSSFTESDPIYSADKPDIALKSEIPTQYTDEMAISAVSTVGYLTEEVEPEFNSWLTLTPPLYSEDDPVFTDWYYNTKSLNGILDWSTGQVVINDTLGSGYILNVHAQNDNPFLAGFYNDTWSPYTPVFEYFGWNYGGFTMGTNGGELILSVASWSGRSLVISPSGNTQINGNIENPNMPVFDPMDGTGTLWYDTSTNIVYRGT